MKTSWRRAFSALLTLAMLLSLLVVPAGAAVELPEGKTWALKTGTDWTDAEKVNLEKKTGTLRGLEIDATTGKFGGSALGTNWVQVNAGTVIKVPVTSGAGYYAQVTVVTYAVGGIKVNGVVSEAKTQTYDCPVDSGYATIEVVTNDYLDSISVAYAEGDLAPVMVLDTQYADLELSGGAVEVTPTVQNGTVTEYAAVSASDEVVTAKVESGKVVLTPVAAGDTTVTVSATLASGTVAPVELPVSVYDAGKTTSWDFMHPSFQKTGNKNYRGLTLASANVNPGYGVGTSGNVSIPVAGKSTITVVVGYTWDLSMDNGTVTSDNAANPAGDTSGKDVSVVFDYTGAAGTATLTCTGSTYIKSITVEAVKMCTKTEGCTLEEGHAGECVVVTEPDIPADAVQAGTIDFVTLAGKTETTEGTGNDARGPVPAVTGLTVTSGAVLQTASVSHGLTAKAAGETITLKLGAPAAVTVVECQYGANKITGVTAGETAAAVEVPERWDLASGDKEIVFESVPAGNMVLTLAQGAFIHSIKVDYATTHTPQLQLSNTTAALKLNEDGSPATTTVTAKTRFTDGAVEVESKKTDVATAAVDANGVITITAVAKGAAEIVVTVTGTELSATLTAIVKAAGETFVGDVDYSWNNSSNAAGYVDLEKSAVNGLLDGLTFTGFEAAANGHGIKYSNGATILMNLENKSTITVLGCQYGAAQNLAATCYAEGDADKAALGTPTAQESVPVDADTTGKIITIKDVPAGKVVLELTGGASWLHGLGVHSSAEIEAGTRNIQVWDFAGKTETGEEYDNNITAEAYLAAHTAATEEGKELFKQTEASRLGCFTQGPTAFGNLTMYQEANDRPYIKTDNTQLATLIHGYANADKYETAFSDGYTALGAWYCNGAGSASKRYITVAQVQAGDTLVVYAGSSSGDVTYTVQGPGEQTETFVAGTSNTTPFTLVAEETGAYKIWPAGGKPVYYRVKLIPGIGVSGALDTSAVPDFAATDYQVKFTNLTTKQVTFATVDAAAKTYKVSLAPGYDYRASLIGATGYGITSETKTVSPALSELKTGKTHDLGIGPKVVYDYTGSITGFAQGYDTSKLVVTLTPDPTSESDTVDLTIDPTDLTFTAKLDPDVDYTASLTGVNDYQIKAPAVINHGEATTENIEVEPKATYAASGKFVVLDPDDQFAPLYPDSTYDALSATVTALSFKNVDDGYTYTATIADGGYTANLRAGGYEAVATVDGYSTKGHVRVVDGAVSRDLMFVPTAEPAAVEYAADVYVGDAAKSPNFKTVTGALDYIGRMTRTGDQRVTVHIAPGTYREQIAVESKNVTFVNDDPNKEVKLTWYYGIGYTYYSASGVSGTESWYDPELAFDRFSKPNADVARWGATVRVRAPGFQAENVTFENSFNRYLTDEELADGVVSNGSTISFIREYGADVASKAATERAAAIWVDTNSGRGDMTEFKNCKFFSSQDTFGTGKRMYLKDCYIEGMTDFICGPGDCVFDTCTLNWKGYSEKEQGGYLTAPQTGAAEKGYLFRNCYVSGDTKLKLVGGSFGRTWGAANTKCLYLNTTLQSADMIVEPSWTEMQNFKPENSTTLLEWGTKLLDGTPVDLSKRTLQNTVLKAEPTVDVKSYFGDWTPDYYVEEAEGVALAAAPTVTDNGDINLPHPGHTLTVAYTLTPEANNANDISTIAWYRVAADGTETLVKTSAANADKTYQIQEADVGAKIKVTVTPKTIGGQTGEAMSFTVAEAVLEGYDDPSGVVDPILGTGVNIFLAGDSTVKDYSADGMWNKGQLQAEGSWGEWLQSFFNDKVTIVNYAQGGRTTRQFIEQDGSLDKIDKTMKEGDFLFMQFGHNDCYDTDSRYVPLGITSAQATYAEGGVYPDTVTYTAADITAKNLKLEAGTHTTYTGYLKEYIKVTEKHGATAVLMTPVARLYYNSDGTIKTHHDAPTDGTTDNEYCKAVKWVYDWAKAQGYNVVFIDNYKLTADLFEKAYADCTETDKQTYGKQLMGISEKTHNSKLGGLIEAAVIAQAIQNADLTISKAVQGPVPLTGKTPDGETGFVVDSAGKLAAYDNLTGFVNHATYWEGEGQKLFDAIVAKAAELNGGDTPDIPDVPDEPADKTALTAAIDKAEADIEGVAEKEDGTAAGDVTNGEKFITKTDKAAYDKAVADAKAVLAKEGATEAEIKAAVDALTEAAKLIQTGTKSTSTGGRPSSGGRPSTARPTTSTTTEPDGTKVTTETTSAGTTTTAVAPDGSKTETVKKTNGDVAITVTNAEGETVAEVKLPATIPAPTTKFKDVPDGHWAEESIDHMAGLGMVKGVSEDTYDMTSPITRGAIATILYRLSDGKAGKTAAFADVAEDAWYADAVGWAAGAGVVSGYSETTFGPEDTITRQQLAVMITRYADLLGLDTAADATALSAFTDGSATDTWAVDGMAWCVKNGVMKGRGNGTLDPKADITRAEAAVMLDRMISLIK